MAGTLVVGPSWVGDMVIAQSLFKLLAADPQRRPIDVLAPAWSLPLLARMPEVASGIPMPTGHGDVKLVLRWSLGRELRSRGYRQAILLPNSLKSALVPFAARIPRRTGYVGEFRWGLLNDLRRLDKQRLPRTVDRFVALGQDRDADSLPPIQSPALSVSAADADAALGELRLVRPARPLAAFCPGAEYGSAKRWPAKYFAALADSLAAAGWDVWLFGSAKDKVVTDAVSDLARAPVTDLAGRTSLDQAVCLLSVADLVVTNDSGLMHVAAALDRPLVAIYGSSDPAFTPPLNPRHAIVRLGLGCSPCFERECPLGHMRCLEDIKPQQVQDEAERLLAS